MGHANPFQISTFQELFNDIRNSSIYLFWPLQMPFEDSKVHWDFNSQSESSLGSVRVHSLNFLALLGAWNVTSGFTLGSHFRKPLPWSWAQGWGCNNFFISSLFYTSIRANYLNRCMKTPLCFDEQEERRAIFIKKRVGRAFVRNLVLSPVLSKSCENFHTIVTWLLFCKKNS